MGHCRRREIYPKCKLMIKQVRIAFTVVFATLLAASCRVGSNQDVFEGEIYIDQMASASGGNVITTETGMHVHLLGVKEGDELGTAFLKKFIGETIHVIEDSHLEQDPVGTDTILGYAVLDDGVCINHMLLKQEPRLFTPINLEDSLEAFRTNKEKPQEISDICLYIKQRTFMIEVPLGGGVSNYGTGFFINDEGLAITNCHVFEGSYDAYCYLYDTSRLDDNEIHHELKHNAFTRDIVDCNKSIDITVFKVKLLDGEKSNYFNLSSKHIDQGAKVCTMGNPVDQANVLTGTFTDGMVSGYRNQDDEKPLVQYTLSTNFGNSGGPVCDKNGRVIAVHCMGDKSKQNVNYGIDILVVRKMLNKLGFYYGGK